MKLGTPTPIFRIFDEAKARETADVDALQRDLLAKRYKYARPGAEDMPWGTRDMSIKDPFGNRLTFWTRK